MHMYGTMDLLSCLFFKEQVNKVNVYKDGKKKKRDTYNSSVKIIKLGLFSGENSTEKILVRTHVSFLLL